LLAFYLACLLGAGYAHLLATLPETGISLWLPSGLLLGALLTDARHKWIWWIGAAAAAELTGNAIWFGNNVPVALLFVAGNIAESVCGAALVGYFVGWPFRLAKIGSALGLVLAGAMLAPTIAAAVGSLTLVWSEGQQLDRAFLLLWVGDATGVLVAAPAVLTVAETWRWRARPDTRRLPEAALFAAGIVLVAAGSITERLPFGLIFLPLMLMAAARFYFWGSTLGVLSLTVLVGLFETLQIEPFALIGASVEPHVQQQLFLSIAAFSTLVVASLAKQNSDTLLQLADSNRQLERRVAERTASLAASEARLRKMMEGSQVGIAFADKTMSLTQANPSLARLLGRPLAALEGGTTRWLDLVAPSARETLDMVLAQLQTRDYSQATEVMFQRPDGTKIPARMTVSRLDSGEHVAFLVDQTEQNRHQEQVRLLMREVNHRAKNLLAVVQAVARQTKAPSHGEFLERFDSRIRALAALQDLLLKSAWEGASLEDIIRGQMVHFGDVLGDRISLVGPPVLLSAAAAQTISLAIHELATNAAKYGALSNETGEIAVTWRYASNERLVLQWVEANGPPVQPPSRRGFGTIVIEKMVAGIEGCSVHCDFAVAGLKWTLEGPTASLVATPSVADANPGRQPQDQF